jgi:hypothetical protein
MIVLIKLFPGMATVISMSLLFSAGEGLEHPIIVIFAAILLITG